MDRNLPAIEMSFTFDSKGPAIVLRAPEDWAASETKIVEVTPRALLRLREEINRVLLAVVITEALTR